VPPLQFSAYVSELRQHNAVEICVPLPTTESFHLSLQILTCNMFTIHRQNNLQSSYVCFVVVRTFLLLLMDNAWQVAYLTRKIIVCVHKNTGDKQKDSWSTAERTSREGERLENGVPTSSRYAAHIDSVPLKPFQLLTMLQPIPHQFTSITMLRYITICPNFSCGVPAYFVGFSQHTLRWLPKNASRGEGKR
jgi:hypothetical protein